jgi:Zn-dependent protease with chaperone function
VALVQAVALLWVMGAAAISLLLALPVAVAAESLPPRSPQVARRFWLITAALPLPAGLGLTLAGLLFLTGNIAASPHQEVVRPHLCLAHATALPDAGFRFSLYSVLALGLLLFAVVRGAGSWLASRRAEALARQLSDDAAPVITLPVADPECFSVGLTRPAILVTQGMREALTEPELAAVIAHERCHVQQRDGLAEMWLRLLTDPIGWLPTTHYALANFRTACEQVCDQFAAEETSKEALSSALEKVAALKHARHTKLHGDLAALQPTFAGHAAPAVRLKALRQPLELSLAPSLRVILALEGALVLAALIWLHRPVHDTLYCFADSLLRLYGPR